MNFDSSNIESLGEWRNKLGLKELDRVKLVSESGSLNPVKKKLAQRKLSQYFDLSPEKMSQEAKTVDMVVMFEKFPKKLRKKILNDLVAFQLTEGCNGMCPFCLFGAKKGVESKFSFDSICSFLDKYKEDLRSWGGATITHYWDSDPFDYTDGEHSYVDVYKEWRKHFQDKRVYISTTVPKGGVENFRKFTNRLFDNFVAFSRDQDGAKKDACEMRISVAKHNVQKVEAVMKELVDDWKQRGHTNEEISAFLSTHIVFSPRLDEDVSRLGPQIADHDDIYDSSSPSCEDGTLLTPSGIEAISMTAATIFEPSGQHNIRITPETSVGLIPHHLPKLEYQGCYYANHILDRTKYKQVLLPLVTKSGSSTELLSLPNHEDDVVFKLGRWCVSLGGIVADISSLTKWAWAIATPTETKDEYLKLCSSDIRKNSSEIRDFITEAQRLSELPENIDINDKLEFYSLLGDVRLQTAEFIAGLIDSGTKLSLISSTAAALGEINKENVNNLSEILLNIGIVHSSSKTYSVHDKKKALEVVVSLMGYVSSNKPTWVGVIEETLNSE